MMVILAGCTIEPVPVPVGPDRDTGVRDVQPGPDPDAEPIPFPPRTCDDLAATPFRTCGGNPIGRWQIVTLCYDVASLDPRNVVSVCGPDATVTGEGTATGNIEITEFGDWRMTLEGIRIDSLVEFDLLCIDDRLERARETCNGANFNGVCAIDGTRCSCTSRQENRLLSEAGIWYAQGASLTVEIPSLDPYAQTFCVRTDGWLDLRRVSLRGGQIGFRLIARRIE